jgi:hypothetical protein
MGKRLAVVVLFAEGVDTMTSNLFSLASHRDAGYWLLVVSYWGIHGFPELSALCHFRYFHSSIVLFCPITINQ